MIKKSKEMTLFDGRIFWQDEQGNSYVDTEIEFERVLSPDEKHSILKHFVLGLEKYDAIGEYGVESVSFLEPRIMKMTIQLISVPEDTVFFALISEFKRMFPVKRWNRITYPPTDS